MSGPELGPLLSALRWHALMLALLRLLLSAAHPPQLDYYDVSMEILSVYLQNFPQSATALNLKACNNYKVYNGKAAEADLLPAQDAGLDLSSHPLIQHNLVVFRDGENALRVLPGLVDAVPEARMNLIIYHLRQGDLEAAQELAQGLDSLSPQATILKAVVHALVGQATRSQPELKQAQKLFQLVGSSATECDTIPGRQCMASCLYLLRQWADVNVYLDSIKQYMYNDDDFNWTYGISLAAEGRFAEAEETLQLVRSEMYTSNFTYLSWLVRCLIANGKAREAWELYVKLDTSPDALNLLQLIANDCYRMGAFFYAAKAFDVLERLEADPEYWEGKRGACIGVFQAVIAGKESPEALKEVVSILRGTSNPQVEYIIRQMAQWATGAGIRL